jgi:carboxypeptidase Taq
MDAYLGLDTRDNFADGPMQDVHWSAGLFGYFPSYTLGSMMAAQQFAAARRAIPALEAQIGAGNFTALNRWRAENVWSKASSETTVAIMRAATGEPLNADIFIAHLKSRYAG